jgi:hypothetical protein
MNSEKTVTLTFTVEQLNVILSGLGKLTLEQSLNIFSFIQNEASKQLTPPPPNIEAPAN